MKKIIATLIVLFPFVYQNCSVGGFKTLSSLNEIDYQSTSYSKALFAASNLFANRLPASTELLRMSNKEEYEKVLREYMTTVRFRDAMFEEHQKYLAIGGSKPGSDIDHDLPARIGAYLVANDRSYTGILRSNFCVDQNYNVLPTCGDTFSDPGTASANAAGVITTRAYLTKFKKTKGYNFNLVTATSHLFICSGYPDAKDPGITADELSDAVHPWKSNPTCTSCHKTINARAVMFYYFNTDGFFSSNPTADTTVRETQTRSIISDVVSRTPVKVLKQTVNSMSDYGRIISSDIRFADCMALRYFNYMTGHDYKVLPADLKEVSQRFVKNQYKVKELLIDLALSNYFLR